MGGHGEFQGVTTNSLAEPPTSDGIEIEALRGIAQARAVERLQAEIWSADEAWVVPSHALLIVSEYGGILLGAHLDGELFHASHMLGVLSTCQHHGIGAALKWRQREVAQTQGLDLMRWTFDPLEARNAYFNFHKLGTVCCSYRSDYYGPMADALNRDLPSDRLLVEWRLADVHHQTDITAPQAILRNRKGTPELHLQIMVPGRPVAVEIPRDFQSIKHEDPERALAWRLAVRQAFSTAFGNGYYACDFRDGAYILLPWKEPANEN